MSFPFRKWICGFTALCVAFSQLALVPQAAAAPIFLPTEVSYPAPLTSLDIPEKFGRVETIHPGKGPFLIHIQDAHGNYDAQKNTRAILHHLKKQYGFQTLFVEGSANPLDGKRLLFTSDKKNNRKINDALTRQGLVKGFENFLVEVPEARGYGIENQETYVRNGKAFLEVLAAKEQSQQFLDALQRHIESLSSAYLNSSLRTFLKRLKDFEVKQTLSLTDWAAILKKTAFEKLDLDFMDPKAQVSYPMLARFYALQQFEKKIDLTAFAKERSQFLLHAKQIQNLEKLLQGSLAQRLPEPETREFFEKMVAALPQNFDFSAYPNLKLFIGHLILNSELEPQVLFQEIETLTEKISAQMAGNETEKKLLNLLKTYRLLEKLFALELTPSDYASLEKTKRPSALTHEFTALNKEARVRNLTFEHLDQIDALYEKALSFYAGTQERDQVMLARLEERLKETGVEKAVIITGGFHAAPFERAIKEKGYSYALITPKITNFKGHETYLKIMQEQVSYQSTSSTLMAQSATDPFVQFPWLKIQKALLAIERRSESRVRKNLNVEMFKDLLEDLLSKQYPDLHGMPEVEIKGPQMNPKSIVLKFRQVSTRKNVALRQLASLATEILSLYVKYTYNVETVPGEKETYVLTLNRRSEARKKRTADQIKSEKEISISKVIDKINYSSLGPEQNKDIILDILNKAEFLNQKGHQDATRDLIHQAWDLIPQNGIHHHSAVVARKALRDLARHYGLFTAPQIKKPMGLKSGFRSESRYLIEKTHRRQQLILWFHQFLFPVGGFDHLDRRKVIQDFSKLMFYWKTLHQEFPGEEQNPELLLGSSTTAALRELIESVQKFTPGVLLWDSLTPMGKTELRDSLFEAMETFKDPRIQIAALRAIEIYLLEEKRQGHEDKTALLKLLGSFSASTDPLFQKEAAQVWQRVLQIIFPDESLQGFLTSHLKLSRLASREDILIKLDKVASARSELRSKPKTTRKVKPKPIYINSTFRVTPKHFELRNGNLNFNVSIGLKQKREGWAPVFLEPREDFGFGPVAEVKISEFGNRSTQEVANLVQRYLIKWFKGYRNVFLMNGPLSTLGYRLQAVSVKPIPEVNDNNVQKIQNLLTKRVALQGLRLASHSPEGRGLIRLSLNKIKAGPQHNNLTLSVPVRSESRDQFSTTFGRRQGERIIYKNSQTGERVDLELVNIPPGKNAGAVEVLMTRNGQQENLRLEKKEILLMEGVYARLLAADFRNNHALISSWTSGNALAFPEEIYFANLILKLGKTNYPYRVGKKGGAYIFKFPYNGDQKRITFIFNASGLTFSLANRRLFLSNEDRQMKEKLTTLRRFFDETLKYQPLRRAEARVSLEYFLNALVEMQGQDPTQGINVTQRDVILKNPRGFVRRGSNLAKMLVKIRMGGEKVTKPLGEFILDVIQARDIEVRDLVTDDRGEPASFRLWLDPKDVYSAVTVEKVTQSTPSTLFFRTQINGLSNVLMVPRDAEGKITEGIKFANKNSDPLLQAVLVWFESQRGEIFSAANPEFNPLRIRVLQTFHHRGDDTGIPTEIEVKLDSNQVYFLTAAGSSRDLLKSSSRGLLDLDFNIENGSRQTLTKIVLTFNMQDKTLKTAGFARNLDSRLREIKIWLNKHIGQPFHTSNVAFPRAESREKINNMALSLLLKFAASPDENRALRNRALAALYEFNPKMKIVYEKTEQPLREILEKEIKAAKRPPVHLVGALFKQGYSGEDWRQQVRPYSFTTSPEAYLKSINRTSDPEAWELAARFLIESNPNSQELATLLHLKNLEMQTLAAILTALRFIENGQYYQNDIRRAYQRRADALLAFPQEPESRTDLFTDMVASFLLQGKGDEDAWKAHYITSKNVKDHLRKAMLVHAEEILKGTTRMPHLTSEHQVTIARAVLLYGALDEVPFPVANKATAAEPEAPVIELDEPESVAARMIIERIFDEVRESEKELIDHGVSVSEFARLLKGFVNLYSSSDEVEDLKAIDRDLEHWNLVLMDPGISEKIKSWNLRLKEAIAIRKKEQQQEENRFYWKFMRPVFYSSAIASAFAGGAFAAMTSLTALHPSQIVIGALGSAVAAGITSGIMSFKKQNKKMNRARNEKLIYAPLREFNLPLTTAEIEVSTPEIEAPQRNMERAEVRWVTRAKDLFVTWFGIFTPRDFYKNLYPDDYLQFRDEWSKHRDDQKRYGDPFEEGVPVKTFLWEYRQSKALTFYMASILRETDPQLIKFHALMRSIPEKHIHHLPIYFWILAGVVHQWLDWSHFEFGNYRYPDPAKLRKLLADLRQAPVRSEIREIKTSLRTELRQEIDKPTLAEAAARVTQEFTARIGPGYLEAGTVGAAARTAELATRSKNIKTQRALERLPAALRPPAEAVLIGEEIALKLGGLEALQEFLGSTRLAVPVSSDEAEQIVTDYNESLRGTAKPLITILKGSAQTPEKLERQFVQWLGPKTSVKAFLGSGDSWVSEALKKQLGDDYPIMTPQGFRNFAKAAGVDELIHKFLTSFITARSA